jgi:hypothetical protein
VRCLTASGDVAWQGTKRPCGQRQRRAQTPTGATRTGGWPRRSTRHRRAHPKGPASDCAPISPAPRALWLQISQQAPRARPCLAKILP